MSFWGKLPEPFFALAPLEDVTDAAFRRLIARQGKPHVMFTEFTSADGLLLSEGRSREKIYRKLLYSESERPIVAQIFSSLPEHIEKASKIVAELGFDGVDINMGCPDRAVEKGGCGAALIKNPALARELIRAAKRGFAHVRPTRSNIPVSVKTRIGYNKEELDIWLPELLTEEPTAITLHARTRKEMSDVPARWDAIARAVQIRDSMQNPRGDASWVGLKTLIVGNGDVRDLIDARAKAAQSGCDGVMLGRAIFGNPWLFRGLRDVGKYDDISNENYRAAPKNSGFENSGFVNPYIPSLEERMRALSEHLMLFDELLAGTVNFATMKKHFKSYISGWHGAKELRMELMDTNDVSEARALIAPYLSLRAGARKL